MFQSTPPAREATCQARDEPEWSPVSIHASRTGGDVYTSTTLRQH